MAELSRMVQEGAQTAQSPAGPDPAQQRQIADQSRQMAEMSRRMDDESRNARDSRGSDGQQERRLEDQERLIAEQNRRMSAMDRKLNEQARPDEPHKNGNDEARDPKEAEQNRQITDLKRRIEEEGRSTRDAVAEAKKPRQPPRQREARVSEARTDSERFEPDLGDESDHPLVQDQDDEFHGEEIDRCLENIAGPSRTAGRREESANRQRDQKAGGGRDVEGPGDRERRPSGHRPDGANGPRPVKTGGSDMVVNRRRNTGHDDVDDQYRAEGGSHVYERIPSVIRSCWRRRRCGRQRGEFRPTGRKSSGELGEVDDPGQRKGWGGSTQKYFGSLSGVGPELTPVAGAADQRFKHGGHGFARNPAGRPRMHGSAIASSRYLDRRAANSPGASDRLV